MNDHHHFKHSPSVWLVPAFFVLALWIVFFIETRFNMDLSIHGILPRTLSGLQGVLFSPFLHGDLSHITNNSIPLFILTAALVYFYRNIYGTCIGNIIFVYRKFQISKRINIIN